MKISLLIVLSFFTVLFYSCGNNSKQLSQSAQKKDTSQTAYLNTDKEVIAFLNGYGEAYCRKDLNAIDTMIDKVTGPMFIGTGKNEMLITTDSFTSFLKKDWATIDTMSWSYNMIKIQHDGNVAWFISEVTYSIKINGTYGTFLLRFSGVLVKRNGNWLLSQSHISMPWIDEAETKVLSKSK